MVRLPFAWNAAGRKRARGASVPAVGWRCEIRERPGDGHGAQCCPAGLTDSQQGRSVCVQSRRRSRERSDFFHLLSERTHTRLTVNPYANRAE